MLLAMSFPAPPMPVFEPSRSTTTRTYVRYEDCTQDGRLIPHALPSSQGPLWRSLIGDDSAARKAMATGIVPILTRLTLTSHEQPMRIDREVEITGGFELAHEREGDEVARIFLNVWTELRGIAGRVGPRQPEGPLSIAGTLFAEHVFTRLFAPPDQRRVTRLEVEGYPAVPEARYASQAPRTAQEPPTGSQWIDELAPDPIDLAFTLDHTDGNQHVNNIVYLRAFVDAAVRRLAATGRPTVIRNRALDIAFRKPCFAGDRVRTNLRLFEGPSGIGAAGVIEGTDGKPRCYVRALFGP